MPDSGHTDKQYDYVVIGSGFGGSVSACRLAQKGYKVLVVEKGRWYRSEDFPRSTWNLKRWVWIPQIRLTGIMRVTFLEHIAILSGVGVGGGSLVYAATLPVPKSEFFTSGTWARLNDWQQVLKPHYDTACRMLGAARNPQSGPGDRALERVARRIGREHEYHPSMVGIFFARTPGESGREVPDPFFGGTGPARAPCRFCGSCMTGCRHNAKNSLDKNYLHLAQQNGARILAETFVHDVRPIGADGAGGYEVLVRDSIGWFPAQRTLRAKGVVFAAGTLGSVKLLLQLRKRSMPRLSAQVGRNVRTNNECLIAVTTPEGKEDFTQGVAIGSVLHADPDSDLEPVRYGPGSGTWRLGMLPMAYGRNAWVRLGKVIAQVARRPWLFARIAAVRSWARHSQILLFMQHLDSTLRFTLGRSGFLKSELDVGPAPQPHIARAEQLAQLYAEEIGGKPFTLFTEQLLNIASTAHILGGAVMGADPGTGVIDAKGRLFGYRNALVCDGSVISANPGVNPSLSITAIAEYIMEQVPVRS
jgi:cholesterol oxidase